MNIALKTLTNNLSATRMGDLVIVVIYLMNIIELCDQHAMIGVKVNNEELVPIAFSGFSSS